MTSQEAAAILAIFKGAYPHVEIDELVAGVWQNTLVKVDYGVALDAAEKWITTQPFWPTVADFNKLMRAIKQHAPQPELPRETGRYLTWQQAKAHIARGYRQHHDEIGTPEDIVEERLEKILTTGMKISHD